MVMGLVHSGVGFSSWHWSVPPSPMSAKVGRVKKCSPPATNQPTGLVQAAMIKYYRLGGL